MVENGLFPLCVLARLSEPRGDSGGKRSAYRENGARNVPVGKRAFEVAGIACMIAHISGSALSRTAGMKFLIFDRSDRRFCIGSEAG